MKDAMKQVMKFIFKRDTVNGNPSKLIVLHLEQPGTEGMILFRQYVLLKKSDISMDEQNFKLVKRLSSGDQTCFLYMREFPIRFGTMAIFAHFFTGNRKTPIEIGVVNQN